MATKKQTAYQHILLPVDFSAHSQQAALRAKDIADHHTATLHLLHIVEDVGLYVQDYDPLLASTPLIADIPGFNAALAKQAKENLQSFSAKLETGQNTRLDVRIGTPARSILDYAGEHSIDLIVMGSHGLHGFEHILGSVSNHILHKAPCDVLIVKEQDSR